MRAGCPAEEQLGFFLTSRLRNGLASHKSCRSPGLLVLKAAAQSRGSQPLGVRSGPGGVLSARRMLCRRRAQKATGQVAGITPYEQRSAQGVHPESTTGSGVPRQPAEARQIAAHAPLLSEPATRQLEGQRLAGGGLAAALAGDVLCGGRNSACERVQCGGKTYPASPTGTDPDRPAAGRGAAAALSYRAQRPRAVRVRLISGEFETLSKHCARVGAAMHRLDAGA